MKSFMFCLLTLLACTVIGCKNNADNKTPQQPAHQPLSIQNSLEPKDTADADIERYDSLCGAIFKKNVPIRYYTVRAVDLMAAMGINDFTPQYHYVRVNLALDFNYKFKLYVQPVADAHINPENPNENSAGTGCFFNEKGEIVSASWPGKKFLADLNAPCPNTCGQ